MIMPTLYIILSLLEIFGFYSNHTSLEIGILTFIIFILGVILLNFIWSNLTKNMDFANHQTALFLGGFFVSSAIWSYFTTTLYFMHFIEKFIH
jgi:drug/metabolite transporter superfamily protein YnfA